MGIKQAKEYDLGFTHIVHSTRFSTKRINVSSPKELDINEYKNKADIFYTPNTYSSPVRRTREYLWQLHRLYVDIDVKKDSRSIDQFEVVLAIEELINKKKIPRPTEYIFSGRGIHVYWDINNCHVMLIDLWERLEDYLYSAIKEIENSVDNIVVDKRVKSPTAILRLPGTINSRSNSQCYSMMNNNTSYNIFDLKKNFIKKVKYKDKKNKVLYLPTKNLYTLNAARLEDFKTIVELRNSDVLGYRNTLIMLYSYHYRLINDITVNELIKEVKKFNKTFDEPQTVKEITYVCRSINRTVKYYKQDNTKGYKFSNKYIIEALDLTKKEQEKLLTIISTEVKYDRNNSRRNLSRRNENGLTKREQQKKDIIELIKSLKELGLNQKEVSKEIAKSLRTVKSYWNV